MNAGAGGVQYHDLPYTLRNRPLSQRGGHSHMEYPDIASQADWQHVAAEIKRSTGSQIERLSLAYRWITDRIIEQGMNDVDLARALRDEESLIKNQVKTEAIKHARAIFQTCHLLATGKKAWDE
jgi:hypothetical protein